MKKLLIVCTLLLSAHVYGQSLQKDVLKKELSEIYKSDQLYRVEMAKINPTDLRIVELVNKQDKIDSINLTRVVKILDSIGYPRKSVYGDSAGLGTFHVIQHSAAEYQEKYLPLFEKAAKDNELEWKWVAMMTDRVRLNKGLKQIYGTQISPIKDPNTGYLTNKAEIAPIEDEKNVNKRRAKVGLRPIEEEARAFGIDYRPKR
jgi:hypothetical protein